MLTVGLTFPQRWRSCGTAQASGLGFQLLAIGTLIMRITEIKKITVQNPTLESVRKIINNQFTA
ncbi:hypothetical protein F4Z99_20175 [Candidatus Poribacteria bacterium]|nr:hypothetical protein [Candidatus Poribacteria bacterium]MYB00764.1 hypothetical protein [Candidatus Poribacteria bacterium]